MKCTLADTSFVSVYALLHFVGTTIALMILRQRDGENVYWVSNAILAAGMIRSKTLRLKLTVLAACFVTQTISYCALFGKEFFWVPINVFESLLLSIFLPFALARFTKYPTFSVEHRSHIVILFIVTILCCAVGAATGCISLKFYLNYNGVDLAIATLAWFLDNALGAFVFIPALCSCQWGNLLREIIHPKKWTTLIQFIIALLLVAMSTIKLVSLDTRFEFLRIIVTIPMLLFIATTSTAGLSLALFCVTATVNSYIKDYDTETSRSWARFYMFWAQLCNLSFICILHSRRKILASIEDRVEIRTRELNTLRQTAIETSVRKAEFLSYLSHEIRNPVHAIGNMIECLAETPNLPSDAIPFIDNLRISNTFILELVTGILDIGKVEMNKFTVNIAPVNIKSLLAVVIEHSKAQCRSHSIQFEADMSDVPENIESDGVKLQQMLYNLISNAIKYTGPGGQIKLKCAYMNGNLILTVADTGVGIPPETLKNLFEPYVQASSAKAGTGLGLAICKAFAQKLGGSIVVDSVLGSGSTFTLTVPASEHVESLKIEEIHSGLVVTNRYDKAGARILVADDSKINRMILSKMLSLIGGYKVFEAENGAEALTIYEENKPFEYIFSDLHMPILDGLELRAKIRDPVQFIIMSADVNLHPTNNFKILTKPFRASDVEKLLGP